MSVFTEAQQVYDTIGAFLAEIAKDPELGPKFTASNTSFHIHYTDPDSEMVMDCTMDPPVVRCGEAGDAEIQLAMSADDGHLFWLGRLNMTIALAKGKVKVTGPISKMMKLLPAMRPAFPKYKTFLEENGHAELAAL
jgi:putative sterol carrier protein